MAATLVSNRITERKGEHSTTLALEVLVFTPDEFAGVLRQAAQDYAFMYAPT